MILVFLMLAQLISQFGNEFRPTLLHRVGNSGAKRTFGARPGFQSAESLRPLQSESRERETTLSTDPYLATLTLNFPIAQMLH